ncbi:MAG: hypothetical protein M1365_01890 [Actinobacteria bacterium]|nr:hypothetical protein [Actinomycetota bacterium]
MVGIIDMILRIFMYGVLLTGIWLFLGRQTVSFIRQRSKRHRFESKPTGQSGNKFTAHIRLLIVLTTGRKGKDVVFYFMFLSICLFTVSFSVFTGLLGVSIFFVLMSTLFSFLPYIYLQFRLKSIQLLGSYEAENLLSELTNMYKISDFNMISAIDTTISTIKNCPLSKKALFILSLKIKEYRSREELQSAIDFFVAMFATEWAALLGMSIFESILNGNNVSVSLDDILSNLKQIKDSIEKDKRANYEAFTMVKFVIPIIYVLSVFVCIKYFGFTLGKFFHYQFYTSLGIKFLITIIVLSIISFWSMYLLSKPKFDF